MEDKISMQQLDQQIQQVKVQAAEFQNCRGQLDSLEKKRTQLVKKVSEYKRLRDERRSELYRLQSGGLNTLLAKISSGRQQKLDICKTMADDASKRYENAVLELNMLNDDIKMHERQISDGHKAQQKLESLLAQKALLIRNSGGEQAQELLECEKQLEELSNRQTELKQAVQAGRGALATVNAIIEKLEKAKNWGTVDLIGGGLVSDLAKHGNLDDASQLTNRLQSQLRDFQKELSDISLHADLTPQISDLLKFADFAFDGLIADWMVLDKISSSLSQAIRTRDRITASLHQLASMQQDCTARQDTLRSQRDAGLSRN